MGLAGRAGFGAGEIGCGMDVAGRWRTEAYVFCWFWGEEVTEGIA